MQSESVTEPSGWRAVPENKQEEDMGMQQHREAQWQEFLKILQAPHLAWGTQHLPESKSWDDAKAFLASFEEVAVACGWPRREWVARLLPALSGGAQQAFSLLPAPEQEDYGQVKAAILRGEALRREKRRQYFRQFCCPQLGDPRRMYSHVQELCCQWLKPERHSKEQILELLVLEQFLAALPENIQSWIRAGGPDSGAQAMDLLDKFLVHHPGAVTDKSEVQGPLQRGCMESIEVKVEPMDTSQGEDYSEDGQKGDAEISRLRSEIQCRSNPTPLHPPEGHEMATAELSERHVNFGETRKGELWGDLRIVEQTPAQPGQQTIFWKILKEDHRDAGFMDDGTGTRPKVDNFQCGGNVPTKTPMTEPQTGQENTPSNFEMDKGTLTFSQNSPSEFCLSGATVPLQPSFATNEKWSPLASTPISSCPTPLTVGSEKKTRASYTASLKLKAVARAKETNNLVAAKEFGVSEKLIRDWRKKEAELQVMPESKKALRSSPAHFDGMEKDLNDWVLECRRSGHNVTRADIRMRALQLAQEEKHSAAKGIAQFTASGGWCTRFMNRYGLCLHKRTKISQKLPVELDEKVVSFHTFITKERQKNDIDIANIGNMDETSVSFDMAGNRSAATVAERTLLVKTATPERNHFTVVLSCLADGTKLDPVIIFKRKLMPNKFKIPAGVVVRVHPKGWMDKEGTKFWLQNVWGTRPSIGLHKHSSLLVWDKFHPHITEKVKAEAKKMGTTLAVIPGGLTSMLQPLDVGLKKLFKDHLHTTWQQWVSSGQEKLTKGGNPTKPDISLVAKWVKDAWDSVPSETVKSSFLKCGITNAMDGSDNNALCEDKDELASDNDSIDGDSEEDVYADDVTEEQFHRLFGNSDDKESDFEGFQEDTYSTILNMSPMFNIPGKCKHSRKMSLGSHLEVT